MSRIDNTPRLAPYLIVRGASVTIAMMVMLAACQSTDETDPGTSAARSIERDRYRAALSAELARGQRVRTYGTAWQVLTDGATIAPGTIRLFYSRRTIPASHRASGAAQAERDYWNREHVWPRSAGIDDTSAETDLHNLVPVDMTINASRGNKVFDEAETPHHECTRCRVSGEAWTPSPAVRGDVARILFYMDVRYEERDEDDVPDLELADTISIDEARFGRLSTLLDWHCADPVSAEERRRHEAVVRAQGNRNAFIDGPARVERLYGVRC